MTILIIIIILALIFDYINGFHDAANSIATLTNEDFDLERSVFINPNPASEVLHINMPTNLTIERVDIYNNLGQIIMSSNANDFSIGTLPGGVNFVSIHTSEGVFHKKFIKK